ncbi:MAG TPA: hypothetical protein VK171_12300 [Fimbriimonas sp.]|nr:hypothetical protein [Fimbriimonas sp.]
MTFKEARTWILNREDAPGYFVFLWLLSAAGIVYEVIQFWTGTGLGKRPDPGGLLMLGLGFIWGVVLYGFERDAFRGSAKERFRAFGAMAFAPMIMSFGSHRALDRTPSTFVVVIAFVSLAFFGWMILMMYRLQRMQEAVL